MEKETSGKAKIEGATYTTAGIRKKSYILVKRISKAVGIKKIDVLSDLIDEMPPEYIIEFVERRKKVAHRTVIKQTEALDRYLDKIVKGKKQAEEIEAKKIMENVNKTLSKERRNKHDPRKNY